MAVTPSSSLPLFTKLPSFSLPDTEGNLVTSDSLRGKQAKLVMFICNHCPFVKHICPALAAVCRTYQDKGVGIVAINSNDAVKYPLDGPAHMAAEKKTHGYTFPYLYDESQEVARRFQAACTPEFYLFDGDDKLVYHGQFDDSRPSNEVPVTGADLVKAMEACLAGRAPLAEQKPSIGCNIKWKS